MGQEVNTVLKPADIAKFMRQEGYAPSKEQIAKYEREAKGNSVEIDYLAKCCEDTGYEDPSSEELNALFMPFDPEGTGFVSTVVFKKLLMSIGEKIENNEMTTLLKEFGASEKEVRQLEDYVNY